MGIFDFIISGISTHPILSVFLATFFLGDEMVYFFAFLSGHGILSLWIVILFSILGNGGCDIFWFSVAKSRYSDKARRLFVIKQKNEEKELIKKELSKKKMFAALCSSKFFYGTRLLTIFYVARKEEKWRKIIALNTLAVIVWVITIGNLMWLVGKWTAISFETINSVHKMIGFAVLFVLIFYIMSRIFVPKFMNVWRKNNTTDSKKRLASLQSSQ